MCVCALGERHLYTRVYTFVVTFRLSITLAASGATHAALDDLPGAHASAHSTINSCFDDRES